MREKCWKLLKSNCSGEFNFSIVKVSTISQDFSGNFREFPIFTPPTSAGPFKPTRNFSDKEKKKTNPGSGLIIYVNHHHTRNNGKSHNCWFSFVLVPIFQIFNIWKRFVGQEISRCFPETSRRFTELTSVAIEERRDKTPRAIIQSSTAEIKSAPMTKVPADSRLEAFLCNYCCCGASDFDYCSEAS